MQVGLRTYAPINNMSSWETTLKGKKRGPGLGSSGSRPNQSGAFVSPPLRQRLVVVLLTDERGTTRKKRAALRTPPISSSSDYFSGTFRSTRKKIFLATSITPLPASIMSEREKEHAYIEWAGNDVLLYLGSLHVLGGYAVLLREKSTKFYFVSKPNTPSTLKFPLLGTGKEFALVSREWLMYVRRCFRISEWETLGKTGLAGL